MSRPDAKHPTFVNQGHLNAVIIDAGKQIFWLAAHLVDLLLCKQISVKAIEVKSDS